MNTLLALPTWGILVIILAVVLIVLAVFISFVPLAVWFRALASGAHVSMMRLIGMKMRKVDYKKIINTFIESQKAGLRIPISELETHLMAGGDIDIVVRALIMAHSAKLDLSLELAKALDLAGRKIDDIVASSITPTVIEVKDIDAMSQDGIEVKANAKVTVRARLDKQIGTADEATIRARIGQGIVTAIGRSARHVDVTANPKVISEQILNDHLDKDTSFYILSVDIYDIDIGENVGSKLKIDAAEAKKKISQAEAEERKAQAIALEQEMKAKTQEMRAIVLAAESEVHKAMATAMRNGKFGVMDYYKLQNMVADTNMRNSIGNTDSKKKEESHDDKPQRR